MSNDSDLAKVGGCIGLIGVIIGIACVYKALFDSSTDLEGIRYAIVAIACFLFLHASVSVK